MPKLCAYCGKVAIDKEHVYPKCLYPESKNNSKVQRLTVPACKKCNNSWANDEAHFRNMLLLAGEPNAVVFELWKKAQRSFSKTDGHKRLSDIISQIKTFGTTNNQRHMISPGQDSRVMNVIKKIVRGLCHYHKIISPISTKQVWADVLKYKI